MYSILCSVQIHYSVYNLALSKTIKLKHDITRQFFCCPRCDGMVPMMIQVVGNYPAGDDPTDLAHLVEGRYRHSDGCVGAFYRHIW